MLGRNNIRAAVLVVTACAFFAGANAFAKKVGLTGDDLPDIPPMMLVFCRFFFGFCTVLPLFLLNKKAPLRPAAPLRLHIGRVLMGLLGLACVFWAINTLSLADVTAIAFSSPIFTMIFAVLFLREIVGLRRSLAAGVGFLGVLIMIRPSPESFQVAALIALMAAAFTGAEVTFIRVLALRDHPLTILLINNCIGAVVALVLALPFLQWPAPEQWPLLVLIGATMVGGQLIFVRAMAIGEAGYLAPLYYANIIFATIYGIVFFNEIPGWYTIAGAGLIIASGLYISLRTKTVGQNSD